MVEALKAFGWPWARERASEGGRECFRMVWNLSRPQMRQCAAMGCRYHPQDTVVDRTTVTEATVTAETRIPNSESFTTYKTLEGVATNA